MRDVAVARAPIAKLALTQEPREGDVVVTRESLPSIHYTIRQLPGIVQFSAVGRDEAVRLSKGFAQKHAVDVWYSDHGTCRLLEVYRPRTASHARSGSDRV